MPEKQVPTQAIAPETHPTIDPIVENGNSPTAIILAIASAINSIGQFVNRPKKWDRLTSPSPRTFDRNN